MHSLLTALEISCYCILLLFMVPIRIENESELGAFLKFAKDFNKSYKNGDFNSKYKAFKISLDKIKQFNTNKIHSSAYYGLTKFSDFFPEEFKSMLTLKRKGDLKNGFKEKVNWSLLPKIVDWREKGVVSEVKNQKNCGACWAFSVVETVESMVAIKRGKLIELSVQQSVDCSTENMGCLGGDTCALGHWLKKNNVSILPEADYPYANKNQTCVNRASKGVHVKDYACANFINAENLMLAYLAFKGPLTAALNVLTWQHYVGGIIRYHCDSISDELNHSVQIVGYNLTGDVPYYIVRNSWGIDFGHDGYAYVAMGNNVCGIASRVLYLDIL